MKKRLISIKVFNIFFFNGKNYLIMLELINFKVICYYCYERQ